MKTLRSIETSKQICSFVTCSRLTRMIVAIAAIVATRSAYPVAIPTYDLTLTENSATILSLTYNGPLGAAAFTVMNTSSDHWTIQSNSIDISFNPFVGNWQEPEAPTGPNVNIVMSPSPDALSITSDIAIAGGIVFPNNTAAPTFVGFDDSGMVAGNIRLTFDDLGDQASTTGVPDTGSTLALFALCMLSLMSLRSLRILRSAETIEYGLVREE